MNKKKEIGMRFRTILYSLLLISIAGLTSCEKKTTPSLPEPQPAKYTIKGVVQSQKDNSAISGVLVTMGSLTQTTGSNGAFEFKDLTVAGKYTLIFTKEGFFDATYSIEFQAAPLNSVITYNLTVSLVPYVPGVTPISPQQGGTITIPGTIPASLSIPSGTTVTDKDGQPVTGSINITAVINPDIVTGTVNNPGIAVLRFEPSGLQFSNPLQLIVDNPLTNYRFTDIHLEYYNETLKQWELKTQPVTYNTTTNKYATTINHFSVYKIATNFPRTYLGATLDNIEVIDNVIENRSVQNLTVTKIAIKRKDGYIFDPALSTAIAAEGITGVDATALANMIKEAIKPYYYNNDAQTDFSIVNEDISIYRVIIPDNKLVTTGQQAIDANKYSVKVTQPNGTTITIEVVVKSAGAVTLSHEEMHYTHGSHGSGGGGTN